MTKLASHGTRHSACAQLARIEAKTEATKMSFIRRRHTARGHPCIVGVARNESERGLPLGPRAASSRALR